MSVQFDGNDWHDGGPGNQNLISTVQADINHDLGSIANDYVVFNDIHSPGQPQNTQHLLDFQVVFDGFDGSKPGHLTPEWSVSGYLPSPGVAATIHDVFNDMHLIGVTQPHLNTLVPHPV